MKTKKILALLFLVAIIAVQGQLVVFAAEPPGVDSPFGDADDDTSPPSLEGGDADEADDADADDADATDADDDDEADILADDSDTAAVAGAQDDASDSENIISESGPGVALLLIPSLILGYAYRRKRKTSK